MSILIIDDRITSCILVFLFGQDLYISVKKKKRFVYLYSVATTTKFIIIYHMYMKINIDRVLYFIYKINKLGQTKMRKTGNEPGAHRDSSHLLLLHQACNHITKIDHYKTK